MEKLSNVLISSYIQVFKIQNLLENFSEEMVLSDEINSADVFLPNSHQLSSLCLQKFSLQL